jgi:hypothetical protein
MKYTKKSPRLIVKYIDADTELVILEMKDRSWMNVGECLTDYFVDTVVQAELKAKKLRPPKNLMVLVVSEYSLEN